MIELLKEKRQAVISHAVTKGLDPNVPMKDSGIQWLGEVPRHWEVVRLKWFSTLQRGYDLTKDEFQEGTVPVVTSGGITGTHSVAMASCPGVVTGRYGSTGQLFYVEEDYWPHNTTLFVLDFHGNNERFAWYSLQTVDFASYSAKSAVPGIDRNDIHVLPVAVPPVEEQIVIAHYLDDRTAKFDSLVAEAERAIELLQERRTALISAPHHRRLAPCRSLQATARTYVSDKALAVGSSATNAAPHHRRLAPCRSQDEETTDEYPQRNQLRR